MNIDDPNPDPRGANAIPNEPKHMRTADVANGEGDPHSVGEQQAEGNTAGTHLTCTNPDCECELVIVQPCPHGDTYTCACAHAMTG